MLMLLRPKLEQACRSRSAREDQEPCKPLCEFCATFLHILDDLTNDGDVGCGDGTLAPSFRSLAIRIGPWTGHGGRSSTAACARGPPPTIGDRRARRRLCCWPRRSFHSDCSARVRRAARRRRSKILRLEIPARAGLLQAGYFTGATFLTPR